jgi:iron(III) transport system substrate-binding protein
MIVHNALDGANAPLLAAFRNKHLEIEVKLDSGSTGPITERAIAEKQRPQADVVKLVNNIALVLVARLERTGARGRHPSRQQQKA